MTTTPTAEDHGITISASTREPARRENRDPALMRAFTTGLVP